MVCNKRSYLPCHRKFRPKSAPLKEKPWTWLHWHTDRSDLDQSTTGWDRRSVPNFGIWPSSTGLDFEVQTCDRLRSLLFVDLALKLSWLHISCKNPVLKQSYFGASIMHCLSRSSRTEETPEKSKTLKKAALDSELFLAVRFVPCFKNCALALNAGDFSRHFNP